MTKGIAIAVPFLYNGFLHVIIMEIIWILAVNKQCMFCVL